jgi:hypothetical protein
MHTAISEAVGLQPAQKTPIIPIIHTSSRFIWGIPDQMSKVGSGLAERLNSGIDPEGLEEN